MILVLVKGGRDYKTPKRRHGLYLVYKWYCQVEDFFCYQAHPLHKNQKHPMISVGELSLFGQLSDDIIGDSGLKLIFDGAKFTALEGQAWILNMVGFGKGVSDLNFLLLGVDHI